MNEKQTAMFEALGEALRDSMPIDADRSPAGFLELLHQLRAVEEVEPTRVASIGAFANR